jgi:hypothetical protein
VTSGKVDCQFFATIDHIDHSPNTAEDFCMGNLMCDLNVVHTSTRKLLQGNAEAGGCLNYSIFASSFTLLGERKRGQVR